jgi:hypothetical protein
MWSDDAVILIVIDAQTTRHVTAASLNIVQRSSFKPEAQTDHNLSRGEMID